METAPDIFHGFVKQNCAKVLDKQQLRAIGFLRITQPMSIATASQRPGQRILEPQLILVVVAINHPINKSWLPRLFEKESEFLESGRCATGKGSMIGYLQKSLLDTENSRTMDVNENIPVVIVDDYYSLHWLSVDNNRQGPNNRSAPTTPQKTVHERAAAIRKKLLQKKQSQFGTSPDGPSSTPAPAIQSNPTDKDLPAESPLSPTPSGTLKPSTQMRLLTLIL
jgi:hypothetical protein